MKLFNSSASGLLAVLLAAMPLAAAAGSKETDRQMVERGRYVIRIGGCNDCHTPGYLLNGGNVPEKDWLVGDRLGFRGGWGTSYPPNLRRYFAKTSEAEWLQAAHARDFRPPMPVPALRAMSKQDLRAVYRFVRSLGEAGADAPAHLPPEQQPTGPVVLFPMPQG